MKILITGTAGFIGFHLSRLLLEKGHIVSGFDNFSSYYDVSLKEDRNSILERDKSFKLFRGDLIDQEALQNCFKKTKPDVVIHLAAQAGVRYSLENPKAYIDSNITGTFNVLESSKENSVKHLLVASTSSVYGDLTDMPFSEHQKADSQLTVYAATKKSCESLCHAYSSLWGLPITAFRFFTVYGTYGRPDLALFKFTKAILDDKPIDIYNNGDMYRDFTYVDDLVSAINSLIDLSPNKPAGKHDEFNAPYRLVNIGNSNKVKLMDFIYELENVLGKKAKYNFMPMQKGDVPATWADTTYLKELVGETPNTKISVGIKKFVEWYRAYYRV